MDALIDGAAGRDGAIYEPEETQITGWPKMCCHGRRSADTSLSGSEPILFTDVYLQAHFSDYVLLPGWFSEHSHLARPENAILLPL